MTKTLKTKTIQSCAAGLLASLMFASCAQDTVSQGIDPIIELPFRTEGIYPTHESLNVDPTTNAITLTFTQPVNSQTVVPGSYRLDEVTGTVAKDITSRVTSIQADPQSRTLKFNLAQLQGGNYLNRNAQYNLSLFTSIRSLAGTSLQYPFIGKFTTGQSFSPGYGEVSVEGPPKVLEINRMFDCTCEKVYVRFNQSLIRAPYLYVEISGLFGLAGGKRGIIPTYPVIANDTTIYGFDLECNPNNRSFDAVIKLKIDKSTVIDFDENLIMVDDVPNKANDKFDKIFNNLTTPVYQC